MGIGWDFVGKVMDGLALGRQLAYALCPHTHNAGLDLGWLWVLPDTKSDN
jgi:hypothetical protein